MIIFYSLLCPFVLFVPFVGESPSASAVHLPRLDLTRWREKLVELDVLEVGGNSLLFACSRRRAGRPDI